MPKLCVQNGEALCVADPKSLQNVFVKGLQKNLSRSHITIIFTPEQLRKSPNSCNP